MAAELDSTGEYDHRVSLKSFTCIPFSKEICTCMVSEILCLCRVGVTGFLNCIVLLVLKFFFDNT